MTDKVIQIHQKQAQEVIWTEFNSVILEEVDKILQSVNSITCLFDHGPSWAVNDSQKVVSWRLMEETSYLNLLAVCLQTKVYYVTVLIDDL